MNLFYTGNIKNLKPYLDLIPDLEVSLLTDKDLNLTVSDLLSGKRGEGDAQADGKPLLFFEDATPDEAIAVLERFEQAGLEPPLLAGKTEMNENWTLAALLEELSQEDLYMALYNEIAERLSRVDPQIMNSDPELAERCIQAALALRDNAELDVLKSVMASLMEAGLE